MSLQLSSGRQAGWETEETEGGRPAVYTLECVCMCESVCLWSVWRKVCVWENHKITFTFVFTFYTSFFQVFLDFYIQFLFSSPTIRRGGKVLVTVHILSVNMHYIKRIFLSMWLDLYLYFCDDQPASFGADWWKKSTYTGVQFQLHKSGLPCSGRWNCLL